MAGLLLLVLAGCSPGDGDPGAGDEPPGQESELAHAQCMRDHGIDFPDPIFSDGGWQIGELGDDVDLESAAYREAESECAQVLRDADPGGGVADPADRAEAEGVMDRMLEFAQCMRDQGVEFPDPQIDDNGDISGPAGPMDGDWEAFDAARVTCEDQTGGPMP
jgi:hypothetical protein